MTVGQRIREKRLEKGLTQTDLAIKMGYHGKTAVCMAERGGDNLTTTKIERFAKALDCSPQYLLFGNGNDYEHKINLDEIPLDAYEPEFVRRAIKFLQAYNHAIPEIQSAVDSLLKEDLSDS